MPDQSQYLSQYPDDWKTTTFRNDDQTLQPLRFPDKNTVLKTVLLDLLITGQQILLFCRRCNFRKSFILIL